MSGDAIPAGYALVRTIGPFDGQTLPKGLLGEHRLKPDRWGLLRLTAGVVTFVWDDGSGRVDHLSAPAELMVPPQVPHHLELAGDFQLEIALLERG